MSVFHKIVAWAQRKSPWILHFNTGACNACDIEIIAALTPRFDLERLGVQLKGTPRHCDILACSGPVTKQVKDRLVRIYERELVDLLGARVEGLVPGVRYPLPEGWPEGDHPLLKDWKPKTTAAPGDAPLEKGAQTNE